MGRLVHRFVLGSLYLLGGGAFVYFLFTGWQYYGLPLIERPRHPLYWTLKPGGELGVLFGIAGASMMVIMLVYSLRKRLRPLRRWGAVGVWLDYHILCGILGPLFIVLHTSFKFGGLVAVSFWSMVVVALSGVLGRFLYRLIPRTRAGDELTLADVEAEDQALTERLSRELDLTAEGLDKLEDFAAESTREKRGVFSLLASLWFERWILRRRVRQLWRELDGRDRHLRDTFERLAVQKAVLRSRMVLWERLRRLFHYWHVFHKPFAFLMYLFMAVHIGVAWMTGYGWTSS